MKKQKKTPKKITAKDVALSKPKAKAEARNFEILESADDFLLDPSPGKEQQQSYSIRDVKDAENYAVNFTGWKPPQPAKKPEKFVSRHAILIVSGIFIAFCLAITAPRLFSSQKIDPAFVVSKTSTDQLTENPVAGKMESSVQWAKIVKTQDINPGQKYIQLPKTAENIKLVIFKTEKEAGEYIVEKQKQNAKTLTLENRKQLAGLLGTRNPSNLLGQLQHSVAGLLNAFLADAEKAVEKVRDGVKEKKAEVEDKTKETKEGKEEEKEEAEEADLVGQTDIVGTEDATLVEIPSEISGNLEIMEGVAEIGSNDVGAEDQSTVPPTEPEPEVIIAEYETPAPTITEQETNTGKLVTVSDGSTSEVEQTPFTDVLAYATISEIYKVGQEDRIKIRWTNNGNQNMQFVAFDLDNNGKLDYVEWTVPHLSEQYFEIIFVSKAFELNQNREIINDIYDIVVERDNNWASVPAENYVRATFLQTLDNTKDITVYARPANPENPATIEVYEEGTDNLIAEFPMIDKEDTYKIYLTSLQDPSDTFDLKIIGGLDIDWIVDPVGWLTGWSYRKAITVSNSNMSATTMTDFPLHVKIAADANIGDGALATGYDIRFTDSGGTTLLAHERESWTGGAGDDATADFWVKGTFNSDNNASTDDTIYMYYGKADAADGQDVTNVWDSNFKGVWHLPNGSVLSGLDSTANNNDGSVNGTVTADTGKIDGAANFRGSDDDYFTAPGSDSLNITGDITMSAWVYFNGNGIDNGMIFNKIQGASLQYAFGRNSSSHKAFMGVYVGSWGDNVSSLATLDDSAWYYVTAKYDGSQVYIYVNGTLDNSANLSGAITGDNTSAFIMGGDTPWTEYTQAIIDEARVSSASRSAAWIEFEYCNMTSTDATTCGASNSNELSFAAQEGFNSATNYYWIGGTGNWSDATHWANETGGTGGYGPPSSSSNAVFDSNSGSGTVTVTAGVSVVDLIDSSANITISTTSNALAVTGDLTVAGTLSGVNAVTVSGGNVTGGSGATMSAPLTLGAHTDIAVSTGTFTLSGVVSGAYNLSKSGAGTATLSGQNTFSGDMTISAGTVSANDIVGTGSLGTSANAVALGDASNKGTLFYTGTSATYVRGFTISAGGGEVDNAIGTLTINTGGIATSGTLVLGATGTITISSIISGAGSLVKAGTTTLTLSGANTFTGGLTIKAGTVKGTTSTSAFGGSGTGAITLGDTSGSASATINGNIAGTCANPITVVSGNSGTLSIISPNTGSTMIFSGAITLNNNLTVSSTGVSPGNLTLTGDITGTGNFITSNASTGTITLSATSINNIGTITNSGAGSGTTTISAVIGSNVTGVIQDSATSALTLSGNNSTVGDIDIQAGTLTLDTNDNLNVSDDWSNAGTFTASSGSMVTFTAGNHTVTGANTFVNWTWNANNTVTLPASTTQTISGTMTCTGTDGNLIVLNSSAGGTKATLSKASGTVSCDYMSITDSSATGGAEWHGGANSTASNYDGWLDFNTTPILTSVADSTDPIKGGSTIIVTPSGQADADSDALYYYCNESGSPSSANTLCGEANLSYASPYTSMTCSYTVSTGDETRTIYCRTYDGTEYSTERTTTYTVDSTAPSVYAGADVDQTIGFTQSGSATDSGSGMASYLWAKVSGPGTLTFGSATSAETTISASENGTYVIRLTATDNAGNSNSDDFTLDWTGSAASIDNLSYTPPSASAPQPSEPAAPPAEQPQAQTPSIIEQIIDIFVPPATQEEEPQITYPPIEEAVPEEAPMVFEGWDIMEVRPMGEVSLSPVGSDIAFFAEKIPQFSETLSALGIDTKDINDVKKVSGIDLYLPGLTKTVLSGPEILAINKFKNTNGENNLQGTAWQINDFAAVQGVPLAELGDAKNKIPSDIIFVRSGGELIDYSMAVSIDKAGNVGQKIKTISGRQMQLVIKPDLPAKRVTGFVTFKNNAVSQEKLGQLASISKLFTASIFNSIENQKEKSGGSVLLVDKFAYTEVSPGIFQADISAPINEGEYSIDTVIEYKDLNLAPKETKMTAIVNPEGYVFSQAKNGKLRISQVSISLMWLNPGTKQYELWPGDKFLQKNPITTDDTGRYSFLVPEGTYKLQAKASGYNDFESEAFSMKGDIIVNGNIELNKKAGRFDWFNWETAMVSLLIILAIFNIWQMILFKRSPLLKRSEPRPEGAGEK